MICLGDAKLNVTHCNWKCVDTDVKTMCTLLILHVSLPLVTMFILVECSFNTKLAFLHLCKQMSYNQRSQPY